MPSLPPEPADRPRLQRGAGLPRRIYLPRTVGLGLGSLCAGAGLHQAGAPVWMWWLMLGYCAAWPHLALRISSRAASPFHAERRNLMLDSLLGGLWVVAMGFNLLPSVLLLAALAMNNLAAGGGLLFARGLVAHALGLGLGLLVLGLRLQPQTSFTTLLWCMPFLVSYPLVLGVVMYRLSIELARRKDELLLEKRRADLASQAEARALAELASRDALTGLHNRRHMADLLARWQQAAQRGGPGFALALVDLDHFKRINDSHGHAAGDQVLRVFAERAREVLRGVDVIGRWGGEEFIVLFPGCAADEAVVAAERLRAHVAATVVVLAGGQPLRVTVSIGITPHGPPEPVEATLERADLAMYQAKSQGRDRVVAVPMPADGPAAPRVEAASARAASGCPQA